MSSLNHQKHIELIQSELIYQTNEFKKLLKKQAAKMFIDHQLYICRYQGFDEIRGNIIVRFDHKICYPPRKNENLQCFVSEWQDDNVKNWGGLTYENLRTKYVTQFESKTVFFNYEGDSTIVGLSGVQIDEIQKYNKNAVVFLAPTDPPLDYLFNLYNFLGETKPETESLLSLEITEPNWKPLPLLSNDEIVNRFQVDLSERDFVIIQGPPGTGKTYLMAQLCASLLKTKQRILVTALTNRALIELAEKKYLKGALDEGLVYKSSLTADEMKNKKVKGIKSFRSMSQQNPPLLLSTYYVMSQIAAKAMADNHFDYVIIEEASQAFLSTIALARKLGKKCIAIGDILQLEPIFHKEYSLEDTNNYHWMIRGLKSISYFYTNSKQYILTESFRLCQRSVDATNAFYNDILNTKSDEIFPLDFNKYPLLQSSFNVYGGSSMKLFDLPEGKIPSNQVIKSIVEIVNDLIEFEPKGEIAILSFYRDTVRYLQKEVYSKCQSSENLFIETVDRIQGLTTDFCIYFIPKESIPFALNINRFNVATSRAKKCTLIICDKSILHFVDKHPEISKFFNHVDII